MFFLVDMSVKMGKLVYISIMWVFVIDGNIDLENI